MNVTEETSSVSIDSEIIHTIKIVEGQSNTVYTSEDAPNEVIIQESAPNIVSVTSIPHTVEVENTKYYISITEGAIPDQQIKSLDDLITGTPVLGSIIEYDGTNWVATMADFEVHSAPDSGNADILYVGKAAPGSADSASVWQIKRVTIVGDSVHIEWANGDSLFDNVWDNRENLSYS